MLQFFFLSRHTHVIFLCTKVVLATAVRVFTPPQKAFVFLMLCSCIGTLLGRIVLFSPGRDLLGIGYIPKCEITSCTSGSVSIGQRTHASISGVCYAFIAS